MNVKACGALLLMTTTLLAQTPDAGKNANQLNDLANIAKSKGDLQAVADNLCRAALLDAKKYAKKCDRAKTDATKALDQFQGDLGTGRFELQHKDYPGALRDLGKITFGPHKSEAQELMQQARVALNGTSSDQASIAALQAAQAAYDSGDFDAAENNAKKVQSPALQSAAHQIITNINVYRDTMAQADALARQNRFRDAEQKYQFAATIKGTGPGHPADKVKQMQAAEAQVGQSKPQLQVQQQPPVQAPQASALQPKANNAARVKDALSLASRDEASGDLKGALRAYNSALLLDSRLAEAVTGKQRVMAEMQEDPKALEDSLIEGISAYYASRFTQADEALNTYLQANARHHEGAAHFYLGASLLSQALLLSPKDVAQGDALRQQALQQFALARQSNYRPLKPAISPRILTQWTQISTQP
jgi:hypothetical protein